MTTRRAHQSRSLADAAAGQERMRADVDAFFAAEHDAPARDAPFPRASQAQDPVPLVIHVVCAGNICRSPAAEALLRAALRQAGVDAVVSSSGLTALVGRPADEQVRRLGAERGVDLSLHRARLFERASAEGADLVLTATGAQCDAVLGLAPAATQRTFALAVFAELLRGIPPTAPGGARGLIAEANIARQVRSVSHGDIPDPYRRDEQVHRDAFARISAAAETIANAFAGRGGADRV